MINILLNMRSSFISIFSVFLLAPFISSHGANEAVPLFNGKDLDGWEGMGGDASQNWEVKDGILSCTGGKGAQWIATTKEFSDFDLQMEFNLPVNGNSGIFIRAPKEGTPYVDGIEIQLLDDGGEKWKNLKPNQFTGAIYAALAPSHRVTKAAGEWQTIRILCVGIKCEVWVNGEQIIGADLDVLAKEYGKKIPGLHRTKGRIGMQNHGDRVSFRKISVRPVKQIKAKLPFFAFQNGVHFKTVKERASVLKELGYDGIGSANLSTNEKLKDRISIYKNQGLKIFSFYVGGKLGSNGHSYDTAISEAIRDLKGNDTVIELYVQGNKNKNTDEQAVAFVREIADQAKESGLRVVIYPHAGFYIDRIGDAVRIAKKCDRDNVGVMFNLCHFLNVEPKSNLKAALENAKPYLWQASVSGAEVGGRSWGQLIQTLDRGTFEQANLMKMLNDVGFSGSVGLQCYAVKGDSRENLKRSIGAWNKINAE